MFLSIFSPLYELVCGENLDNPAYRDTIFNSVGLLTIVVAVVICLVFYVVLGRWKSIWHTRSDWAITAAICAAIGFGLAYSVAKEELGEADSYVTIFAAFNAIFAAIYFIAFSFLFKNFSIFAKRTPV